MVTVGQGIYSLPVDPLEQLPCDVNRCFYMLLLFLFALLSFCLFYFSFLLIFLFFRDSNMISISTVGFRYYVVIIILVNLEKP